MLKTESSGSRCLYRPRTTLQQQKKKILCSVITVGNLGEALTREFPNQGVMVTCILTLSIPSKRQTKCFSSCYPVLISQSQFCSLRYQHCLSRVLGVSLFIILCMLQVCVHQSFFTFLLRSINTGIITTYYGHLKKKSNKKAN